MGGTPTHPRLTHVSGTTIILVEGFVPLSGLEEGGGVVVKEKIRHVCPGKTELEKFHVKMKKGGETDTQLSSTSHSR